MMKKITSFIYAKYGHLSLLWPDMPSTSLQQQVTQLVWLKPTPKPGGGYPVFTSLRRRSLILQVTQLKAWAGWRWPPQQRRTTGPSVAWPHLQQSPEGLYGDPFTKQNKSEIHYVLESTEKCFLYERPREDSIYESATQKLHLCGNIWNY